MLTQLIGRLATAGAIIATVSLPVVGQQAGAVQGRAVEQGTSAAATDVLLRLEGTSKYTTTGPDGRYRIAGVVPGSYTLVAQRMGIAPQRIAVTVRASETTMLDLSLAPEVSMVAPVVVSGSRELQHRSEGSATIDALDGMEIRRTRAAHPAGILNRIPGVHVVELSGEGHMMSMRQPMTTSAVYLYLEDGVPTRATGFFNHNALYEVNIPQSGGIEIVKGPGTALYGSDAIGGVVNVLTHAPPATPEADLSLEGGLYGYGRLLLGGGLTSGNHGFRADVNLMRNSTWKDDAPFSRESATLRWDAFDLAGWSSKTVLTGSNIHQQDTPTLSQSQFDGTPALNRAPIAYRKVQAARLSSAFERESGSTLWSFTPYARYDVLDLMPSWQLSYDQQVWLTKNNSIGVLAKYRRDFAPMKARIIAGVDADYSPGSFTADKVISVPTGPNRVWSEYTTGARQYDYGVTYRAASPYFQLELTPVNRLRLDAGLRYDLPGYSYENHLTPLDTGAHRRPASTDVSYAHLSPKFGLTFAAAPDLNLYASYRHGFRAPSQGQLFQQNSAKNTVGLEPVKVDSWEAGVRGQAGKRILYQFAAYDMTVHDDILTFVTPQNTREATNAGATRHRGVEARLGALITEAVRAEASWSVSDQRYVQWIPQAARAAGAGPAVAEVNYAGRQRESAPRDIGSVLLTWSPHALRGGRTAVEWSHTGAYAMDPNNTRMYPGYDVVNLHLNYFVVPSAELFARVVNAANAKYAELATWDAFQKEQYNPGTPRAMYAGVRWVLR